MKKKEKETLMVGMLSGVVTGLTTSVVFSPLDVCKVRLQVQRVPIGMKHLKPYDGIFKTWAKMVQSEGVLSLYKGIFPTMIAIAPSWFIFFSLYGYFGELAKRVDYLDKHVNLKNLVASVAAGSVNSVALQPIWTLKVRQQMKPHFPSMMEMGKEIYSTRRIRGFYRGLFASIVGLSHVAVQFPVYEYLKRKIVKRRGGLDTDCLTFVDIILATSVSKIIAATIAYPHEIVRSRLQSSQKMTEMNFILSSSSSKSSSSSPSSQDELKKKFIQYRNTKHCVKSIYQIEGLKGFYGGLTTNFVKTIPQAVVTLLTYEKSKKFFRAQFSSHSNLTNGV